MKDNKLITEFMGYPKIANDEDKKDYLEDCVKYHTEWNWMTSLWSVLKRVTWTWN